MLNNTLFAKYQREIEDSINRLQNVGTFLQIEEWDRAATNLLNAIGEDINRLDTEISNSNIKLENQTREHQSKSIFGRVFGKNELANIRKSITNIQEQKASLEKLADKLQEMIDFTPNDPEAKKNLLKELRLQKKELQTEKRDMRSQMANIRLDARQKTADRAYMYGFKSWNALTSIERRNIRIKKEIALAPLEDVKKIIDQQIIKLERQINWLERIRS